MLPSTRLKKGEMTVELIIKIVLVLIVVFVVILVVTGNFGILSGSTKCEAAEGKCVAPEECDSRQIGECPDNKVCCRGDG